MAVLEVEQRRIVAQLRHAARIAGSRAAEIAAYRTARRREFGNTAAAFLQEDLNILKLKIPEIDLDGLETALVS